MNKKTLIIGGIFIGLLLLFASIKVIPTILDDADKKIMEENKPKYQGPVPEGYDEDHFRETGITKPKKTDE